MAEGQDFMPATDLQKCSWFIDVAGSCNLKCISCPRGNWPRQPRAGFMKVETFSRTLDKILAEDPFIGAINLYAWGEPLMHPRLAEIIRLSNAKGLQVSISSNLSLKVDFEDVIKARPTYFRVSASGWDENYEVTHAGGRWDLFLENLRRLAEWWPAHHPDMIVEMNYHIYRDRGEDYNRMRALCQELGIVFRAGHGRLHPLDNIRLIQDKLEVSREARQTVALQSLPIEDGLEMLSRVEDSPCPFKVMMELTWDNQARHCLAWFDPDIPPLAENFLDQPLDEILSRRRASDFCRFCQARYLHRWCNVYGEEALTDETTPEVKAAHSA